MSSDTASRSVLLSPVPAIAEGQTPIDEKSSPPEDPEKSHTVARAWRLRAVHAQDTGRQACGLCLCAWPCPQRIWAEQQLQDAALAPRPTSSTGRTPPAPPPA